MANTKKAVDVRDTIVSYIKEDLERPLNWITKKTNIPYGTVYSTFVQKVMDLSQENLDKINKAFNTEFTLQ